MTRTRYFYDTEFVEDGRTIDLISIGIVCEDGRELYRVVNSGATISRAVQHPWLRKHVVPSLPIKLLATASGWDWAPAHLDFPCVATRSEVAEDVRKFLTATPTCELWAWYGSYDHVALSQLWGRMVDHPNGIPMWTNDLRQECHRLGDPQMPTQESGEHNALADARHDRVMAEFLDGYFPPPSSVTSGVMYGDTATS
jgi:hypothetical protein